MSRDIPFDKKAHCDVCDKQGAFDIMGDYYCWECLIGQMYEYDDEDGDE